MDTKALQLLSRYSLPPNSLHYCGLPSATNIFTNCIIDGKCREVKKEVKQFIVLWPYLKTIGEITNLDPFSSPVIEAYWFGNQLLKQITPDHYPILLKNLQTQGVPKFLIDEIKTKTPTKFVPIHLFNILHVGVGKASGSVPFNLDSINNCMLRWGKIIKINPPNTQPQNQAVIKSRDRVAPAANPGIDDQNHLPTATIKLNSLKRVGSKYKFQIKNEVIPYNPEFTPLLRLGQTATVHWNLVCKILTQTEETNLALWTTTLINSI